MMSKAIDNLKQDLQEISPDSMMITVRRSDVEKVVNDAFFSAGEWNNQSCLGYAIKAALETGLTENEIHKLVGAMHKSFDEKTLEESADIYRNSPY